MLETGLFFVHYALLLVFGLVLSAAFEDIRPSGRNVWVIGGLAMFCGLLQIAAYLVLGETLVWQLYPLLTHLPLVAVLCGYYRRPLTTVLASVATAYLCCQPANWFGLLVQALGGSAEMARLVSILVLLLTGFVALRYLAAIIAHIYSKSGRDVWHFGVVPIVYYLFDYGMGVYTDLWLRNGPLVTEFLSFFLCAVYLVFCTLHAMAYDRRVEAEYKEQLLRLTAEQQARELEAMRRSEYEIRLLRHDMRHFLGNLSLCLNNNDLAAARQLLQGYVEQVDATVVSRYCRSETINYLLSAFAARCQQQQIVFLPTVEQSGEFPDAVLFSAILSNALENALNAQAELPADRRSIRLVLKNTPDQTHLLVENPVAAPPQMVDGMPITEKSGHGYGSQSIRYLTERLGGSCRFLVRDGTFVLQVLI